MTAFLIGGGWTPAARHLVYGPFLDAAGSRPTIACVVVHEGDGRAQFERWSKALSATAPCTPRAVLVAAGERFEVPALADADAVLVCGGPTPAYAAALAPAANALEEWLRDGRRPYAGFSAGAAVAARAALVGGWQVEGVPVCPEDASEDLDAVTVVDGLGRVRFTVDVHAAQWGTLGRLIGAVESGLVVSGIAIDEDTAIVADGSEARVAGLGRVHVVSTERDVTRVRRWGPGQVIEGVV